MEVGIVGLGRMGLNMARRASLGGHRAVGFDSRPEAMEAARKDGIEAASTLDELVSKLSHPRVVLIIVTESRPVDGTISVL